MHNKLDISRLASALSAMALTTGLVCSTARAADPDLGVASSGATIATAESASTYSPSAVGLTDARAALDSYAEFRAAGESAGALARLLGLPAVRGTNGQESIIGADNRVRVNPTTSLPARATVLIAFSAGRCTGWLINRNTVVTAGHCVAPGNNTGFYSVPSYRIYPGRNGTSSP